MKSNKASKKKLAIFASGGGSNAEAIINHFESNNLVEVSLVLTNNPDAYVLKRAENHKIPAKLISKEELIEPLSLIQFLQDNKIDLIVLAGFLKQIPEALTKVFPKRIVNIHPALLPKFGGKGMYGHRVHQAVFDSLTLESGITIHYVNEHYDEGQIIFQAKVSLDIEDTPKMIAKKVLELEHLHYPKVIEELLLTL